MLLHHIGISAQDVKTMIHFYTEIIGLELMETVNLSGTDYYFVGDGRMMIEIEPAYNPGNRLYDNGFSHVALAVDDLEEYSGRLREKGVRFLLEPSQFRPDRKIAFIEDQEGNKIQLIQFVR